MVDGSFCPLPQQLRVWHIDAAQEPSTASVLLHCGIYAPSRDNLRNILPKARSR